MELQQERLELKIFDGTVPTYVVRPRDLKPRPGLVLAMEAFGLTPWLEAQAQRLAEDGFVVAVPDLRHRRDKRVFADVEEEAAQQDALSLLEGGIVTDMAAALDYLKQPLVSRGRGLAIVGFGYGGRVALQTACHHIELRLAVAWCPIQVVETSRDPRGMRPIDRVPWIRARVLAFYGGDDERVPESERSGLAEILRKNRKPHDIVVYPGAGHAFYASGRPAYVEAAAKDAWRRMLELLHSELH